MADLSFDRDFDPVPGRCERLSPLVRRVLCGNPGPFTFRGTASFIVGSGTVAIVDPGPDDEAHFAALLEAVRGETVSHILVTHTHRDHSPLSRKLKAATGATVRGYGPHGGGGTVLDASADEGFAPDIAVRDGDVLEGPGWRVACVHTPGHTSNHMAFALEQERALFVGDHVMAWATSVVAPPDGHMGSYFASLAKLLERDDAVYHPAHGPSRAEPKSLVRGYLAHRRMREEAILARVKAGGGTLAAIAADVYAGIDPKLAEAARLSARAHLEHLMERGLVREADGRYRLSAWRFRDWPWR